MGYLLKNKIAKGGKEMFKKFRKSSKILSLILALIMVLGLTSTVFAAGEDQIIVDTSIPRDFRIMADGGETSYKTVTVKHAEGSQWPDDTKYTAYLNFTNSSIDLANVNVKVRYDSNLYNLEVNDELVNGSNIENIDFSKGYVNFTLINILDGREYRNYQINAGIEGTDVELLVTFNVKNATNWLRNASRDHKDYEKVENALQGFSKAQATPVTVKAGDTAMEALEKAAEQLDLELDGANQGYIRQINKRGYSGLREFDMTSQSGWMYKIDGIMPNVGASQCTINSSFESMEWGFTLNWGQDLGGAPW